jgi:hypothetical protein
MYHPAHPPATLTPVSRVAARVSRVETSSVVGCPLSVDASKAAPNDVDDASHRRVSSRTTSGVIYSIDVSPGRRASDRPIEREVPARAFMTTPLYCARHDNDDVFSIGIDDARAHPFDERIDDDAYLETLYIPRPRVIVVVVVVEQKRRNKDDDAEEQRLRKKG